jgi:hypothetical protein
VLRVGAGVSPERAAVEHVEQHPAYGQPLVLLVDRRLQRVEPAAPHEGTAAIARHDGVHRRNQRELGNLRRLRRGKRCFGRLRPQSAERLAHEPAARKGARELEIACLVRVLFRFEREIVLDEPVRGGAANAGHGIVVARALEQLAEQLV